MEKNNNSSNSSMCKKIRQALSGNPAVRAIQRISSFNQEPKPVTKPLPQHKSRTEGSGTIPINFDHTTPKSTENIGNKAVPTPSVPKGGSEKTTKEPQPQKHHGPHGRVESDQAQQGKLANINDIFEDYIKRTGDKLRTISHIGWGRSDTEASMDHEAHGGSIKNEGHKDHHFSEFINRAKKKLRTKTTVGKSGSLKKE